MGIYILVRLNLYVEVAPRHLLTCVLTFSQISHNIEHSNAFPDNKDCRVYIVLDQCLIDIDPRVFAISVDAGRT